MKKLLTLTALGVVMIYSNASASGFFLREQSAAAQGNAFAGATAGAEDISYSFFNPAALSRHKGTQMVIGGSWIVPDSRAHDAYNSFEEYTSSTNNIIDDSVTPHIYVSHQVDKKLTLGASLNVPFGMTSEYDEHWAGRYHGTTSKVTAVTLTPMASYKLTDELAIGAGVQLQYTHAELENGVYLGDFEDYARLEGDTFDIGYQLGALYEPMEGTRFGVGYRSQVKQKLKGDVEFDGPMFEMNQDITARLTTPATLSVGAYHEIDCRWSVMAEYSRVYWSSFDELNIIGEYGPISYTDENWSDSNFYAIGASYQMDDQWKLRMGIALDDSAVGIDYRTPRIPDSHRTWYSLGLEYKYSKKTTFNVGYTYIYARDASVSLDGTHTGDSSRGGITADYENSVNIITASINYKF